MLDFQEKDVVPNIFMETLIHLLKGNLGAGLFAMGDAFKNSGFILGVVGTLLIGGICIYNNHLLVRLSRQVKEFKKLPKSPTFPETVSFAFELGPPRFMRMRGFVMGVMKSCIIITQLGFCVIYITFVARSIQALLHHHFDFDMDIRLYTLATFPVVLSVSLIHTLKFLAPVSALSMICIAYGYIVALILCSLDLPDISSRTFVAPPLQWPLFVGTVIFAFEGIALVIPLKNEMKNPEKFDSLLGVLNIGMSICMNMLIAMGVLSFWKFGDEISGSVTFDLPSSWPGESARMVVAIGILLTYPLQFYVPVKLFFRDMKSKWGPFRYPLLVELSLRTLLVIVTYIFAVAIPHVNLVVSLIGAVCSNALALLFPALSDISLRLKPKPEDEKEAIIQEDKISKKYFRFFMNIVSIILSILGAIFGAYVAIKDIAMELKKDFTNN